MSERIIINLGNTNCAVTAVDPAKSTQKTILPTPDRSLQTNTIRPDRERANDLTARGRHYLQHRRLEPALECAKQAVDLDERSGDAWRLLGLIHEDLGQQEQALAAHIHAVNCNPASADFQLRRAVVLMRLERYSEALEGVQNARKAAPRNPDCFLVEGTLQHRQGDHSAALLTFEAGLRLDPQNPFLKAKFGQCLLEDAWKEGWYEIADAPDIAPCRYPGSGQALQKAQQALARFEQMENMPEDLKQRYAERKQHVAGVQARVFDGHFLIVAYGCLLALVCLFGHYALLGIFWFGAGTLWYCRAAWTPRWLRALKRHQTSPLLQALDTPAIQASLCMLAALGLPITAAYLTWRNPQIAKLSLPEARNRNT